MIIWTILCYYIWKFRWNRNVPRKTQQLEMTQKEKKASNNLMLLKKMNQYSKTLLKINPMWRRLHQGSNHYLVQTSEWLKSSWKHKDMSINAHNSLPEANASLISKLGQCRTEEGKLPNNLSGNGCINLKPSPKAQKKNKYQVDFIS